MAVSFFSFSKSKAAFPHTNFSSGKVYKIRLNFFSFFIKTKASISAHQNYRKFRIKYHKASPSTLNLTETLHPIEKPKRPNPATYTCQKNKHKTRVNLCTILTFTSECAPP